MTTVSATPLSRRVARAAVPVSLALVLTLGGCTTLDGMRRARPEATDAAACAAPVRLAPPEGGAFVWRNPLPQGDALLSVWGAAPDNLWAVGDRGRVLRFDGAQWHRADPGPRDYLAGVWGSGPGDVFVTGYNGQVLHFDGSAWWKQPTGVTNDFNGIWGSGPKDVFTVGDRGVILHYDGTCWRPQATGTEDLFFGVSGTGPRDVWAVGGRGNVAHYDGAAWRTVDVSAVAPDAHFVSVWAAGAGEVYVAGTGGTVLHLHKGTWTREDAGTDALLRWAWGTGPRDVWVAGDGATVRRFDGAAWRPVDVGVDVPPPSGPMDEGEHAVRGAWAAAASKTTVLVGDDGLIVMGAGDALRPVRTGPVADLYAVAGAWAAGSGGTVLFRDTEARWHTLPKAGADTFLAIALLADGRVLAAGTGGMWLGDAHGWRRLPWPEGVPEGPVFALKAWDRRAVAVGSGGLVLAFDGAALTKLPAPGGETLFGVAGAGPDDFLAVGAEGAAYLRNGGAWRAAPVSGARAGGEDLMAVSDGGIAVGAMGGVYRRTPEEAGGWRTLAAPGGTGLNAVADDPAGGAWAAGDFGAVRHVEGDAVQTVDAATGRTLHGVAVAPDGRVTLVGDGGAVLERPPAPGGTKIE